MRWKTWKIGILTTAIVLASAASASAHKKNHPGYLTLGASYTYGYGADGNDYGGVPKTHEHPGFGYTDTVYDYLLDQKGNRRMEHLNLAIGGATSGEINEFQLEDAVEFLRKHRATITEIASGGNDLLGFMLFPQTIPEAAIPAHLVCNMNTPYYDLVTCDQVISGIIAGVETNLRITLDTIIEYMAPKSTIILRSFPNAIADGNTSTGHPAQPFPVPFTCEGTVNPQLAQGAMDALFSSGAAAVTGYGVATSAEQIDRLLFSDTEALEGLNIMIARVAEEYAEAGYDVGFADIDSVSSAGPFWDCIHPSDAGHDAIAEIVIETIEAMGKPKKKHRCK